MKTKFKVTKEMISAAENVFLAMAFVETISPIVLKIQQDVLNQFRFPVVDDITGEDTATVVETPKDSYQMSDTNFLIYQKELEQRYIATGLEVRPEYCPLLVAKKLQNDAERELIAAMEPVAGIKHSDIFCRPNALETYRKVVDLSLGLLSPYCQNILKK